ncbi:MAG: PilZ domain-containing protein [Burkholderiaceae bacterium]|jgi:hypothetical protein|nr:PilZ domain-containing protein [Burkholderiaceae bacterium]
MPYERRNFTRVLFQTPGWLSTDSDNVQMQVQVPVQVQDLSLKGALVKARKPLSVGTMCQLTVPLTESHYCITMSMQVAQVQQQNMGLVCCSIDLDSVTHLRRLIELQLGDPSLLERDLVVLCSPGDSPGQAQ